MKADKYAPKVLQMVADGQSYRHIANMEEIDIAGMEKEFLLILSNRDKYAPQSNKSQNSFDVVRNTYS